MINDTADIMYHVQIRRNLISAFFVGSSSSGEIKGGGEGRYSGALVNHTLDVAALFHFVRQKISHCAHADKLSRSLKYRKTNKIKAV